ncbi:MAG: hypothetical protein WBP81_16820 [Solirubrobacteraceae bacterium]
MLELIVLAVFLALWLGPFVELLSRSFDRVACGRRGFGAILDDDAHVC